MNGIDEEDRKLLNEIEDIDPEISFGKYTLLKDKDNAEKYFQLMDDNKRKYYEGLPIFNVFRQLK